MNRNIYIATTIKVVLICFFAGFSCQKKATDYRSYLAGGEHVYPGTIAGPTSYPGNGRLELLWHPSPDPTVAKYVVYWNNYADSVVIPARSHNPSDTVKTIISNLAEYNYSFFVNSFDSSGNESISTTINNARVYGPIYQGALHNRLPNAGTPYVVNPDNSVTLNFNTPDTINITTSIRYTNAAGTPSKASIAPNVASVTLPSYLYGAPVLYQSSYIPAQYAIDTFVTLAPDTFPPIYQLVQCDKSLFQEMTLFGDDGVYQPSTSVSMLWNGAVGPQAYPNIYHSATVLNLPIAFSFDMGAVYKNLAVIEETGRNCCHNPDHFEVWGIADTTNASPNVVTEDPGWKGQMQSLGWTLLTEAYRSDDGSAPMKFNFINNPPPVRFIRFRVLHDANGTTDAANMSQLTFWNKQ